MEGVWPWSRDERRGVRVGDGGERREKGERAKRALSAISDRRRKARQQALHRPTREREGERERRREREKDREIEIGRRNNLLQELRQRNSGSGKMKTEDAG